MSYNFETVDRHTAHLPPPSVKEWLPAGHLAWLILGAVAKTNGREAASRHPSPAYCP